jgi:hypothetical protein
MEEQDVYDALEFDYFTKGKQFYQDPARDRIVSIYLCPVWPDVQVIRSMPPGYEYQLGAVCTYTGVGGAIRDSDDTEHLITSAFGLLPDNGAFTMKKEVIAALPRPVGTRRKLGQIIDGQSNSFLIGEFVHRNCEFGQYTEDLTGFSTRPWYLSGFQDAPYAFKTLENPPNVCVSRAKGIPFNYVPLGSFHPGITQFVFIDGSVQVISDDIDVMVYKDFATCSGGDYSGPPP